MNKSCTNCGTSLHEGAQFCPQCGTRVEPAAAAPIAAPPKGAERTQPRSALTKVVAIAAIAAIIALVLYNHFHEKEPPSDSRAQTMQPETALPRAEATPAQTETPSSAPTSYPEWKPSSSKAPKISLVPELTIVTAIAHPAAGDYESIKRIQSVSAEAVEIAYSSNVPGAERPANSSAAPPRKSCTRSVLSQDLRSASQYRENFCSAKEESYPGTTAIGVSAQVLADLKTKGEANIKYQTTENAGDPDQPCVLKRVEATDVAIPVLVNDRREQLPAVHARCVPGLYEMPSDFYFLDDPGNPLALAWQLASANKLQVVKITVPNNTPQIEQSLEQTGRAEVYGIYFDFGSASIRPESEPVLKEIAGALEKNPAWKLSIEGHTDNVGGDSYNLDLSRRRAEAVKQSLVERYHVAAGRLTTAGFGASHPKETNETLEGRARNRRVELVR